MKTVKAFLGGNRLDVKDIFVGFTVPPSLEDIGAIAETILDDLPEGMQKYTGKLKIQVEDFPDEFITQEMEIETPFDLLGCYQSSGLPTKTNKQDVLYLYRRPMLDIWAEGNEDLTRIINRVMLQEIGHHFGFSADEIEMYEEDMLGATASNMGVS
jgi:predicted Zn-dependent protease with MMP-like domain